MDINAKAFIEIQHTHERVLGLLCDYVYHATGAHLSSEGDYQDLSNSVLNILLDLTKEVDSNG